MVLLFCPALCYSLTMRNVNEDTVLITKTELSYSLTMRNVNSSVKRNFFFVFSSGYSLTMRNVNISRCMYSINSLSLFINYEECKLFIYKFLIIWSRLFINYEECKLLVFDWRNIVHNSYSLTMRNVNILAFLLGIMIGDYVIH